MKNTFLSITFAIATLQAIAQQEAQYTQNQFNSNLLLNPAYAGSDPDNTSIGIRYRNQWVAMDGSPKTYSFIGDTKWKSLGIGLSYNYDKVGIERISTPDLNVSYHAKMKKEAHLSLGIKAGYQMIKADFSQLVNINPSDPLYTGNGKATIPYLGLGALYYSPKFYIGASSPRLVTIENPISPRSKIGAQHFYLYGGARIKANDDIQLRPALLFKYQSKAPFEMDLAIDAWYKNRVGVGVGYRTGDAVNFMLKSNWKKTYLGYSYDMNISRLNPFNHGSHEILLGFKIPKKKVEEDQDRNQNGRYF